jgi:hypothetical protein
MVSDLERLDLENTPAEERSRKDRLSVFQIQLSALIARIITGTKLQETTKLAERFRGCHTVSLEKSLLPYEQRYNHPSNRRCTADSAPIKTRNRTSAHQPGSKTGAAMIITRQIECRFIQFNQIELSTMSSGVRAWEGESRNVFLKDEFTHDSSLHCFLKPITPSLSNG